MKLPFHTAVPPAGPRRQPGFQLIFCGGTGFPGVPPPGRPRPSHDCTSTCTGMCSGPGIDSVFCPRRGNHLGFQALFCCCSFGFLTFYFVKARFLGTLPIPPYLVSSLQAFSRRFAPTESCPRACCGGTATVACVERGTWWGPLRRRWNRLLPDVLATLLAPARMDLVQVLLPLEHSLKKIF